LQGKSRKSFPSYLQNLGLYISICSGLEPVSSPPLGCAPGKEGYVSLLNGVWRDISSLRFPRPQRYFSGEILFLALNRLLAESLCSLSVGIGSLMFWAVGLWPEVWVHCQSV
jgi:hypothetical protein